MFRDGPWEGFLARYVAAIDQGTTGTRFMVVDHGGEVIALEQRQHDQLHPRPGWVEHDPLQILARAREVVRVGLARCGIAPADLVAVGIANQRETTVVWDRRTGKPIANAIVWQDVRTAALCNELARDGGQDRFRASTGLPLSTYFSGPKVRWLLDHVPGARESAERGDLLLGTIDSWLIWNLTGGSDGGVHVTDVTNASRTLLMSLTTLDWDREILEALGIPERMLPRIEPSSMIHATARGELEGVQIAGILGDQQAALFGQACFSPGEAKNTYHTGNFLLMNTGTEPIPSTSGLLTSVAYRIGEEPAVYCLEGAIAVTGAMVKWLRDNLRVIRDAGEVEALARSVPDNGGCYFVPAFCGLFAPYWRSDARGVIAGLTSDVDGGHIARAVLEATAYQTKDVVEAMNADSGVPLTALKVDGGMAANELLMQFQADVLDVPVIRPTVPETSALGAAYAAGLAVGYWNEVYELRANWRWEREWAPAMQGDARDRGYRAWKKAVQRTLDWADAEQE
jgi:glycerol kinase